jgi:hypothetical protein
LETGEFYALVKKMSMDINQIIELWRSLSPRLAKAISGQALPKDEHTDEKKRDEDSEDKTVDPIESHDEKDDV